MDYSWQKLIILLVTGFRSTQPHFCYNNLVLVLSHVSPFLEKPSRAILKAFKSVFSINPVSAFFHEMSQFSFFYSRRIVTVSKVLNVTIICGAKVARAHHTSEQLIPDDPNNLGVAPIFREPNDFCSGVGGPRNLLVKNILGPTAKTLGKLGDLLSIRRAIKFHKISQTKIKSRINLNFKQFYHF